MACWTSGMLLVMAHNAREMALTKLYTKYETDLNVSKQRTGADIARMQGKRQGTAATLSAAGSLIGGLWPVRYRHVTDGRFGVHV